jgi:glycosyltransferase involved in cell wall biosynthesis
MKLLWLSHFVPYPPRGGARQRAYNLLRHVSRKHDTELISLNLLGESRERVAAHKAELEKLCKRVEIWDTPYPWRGARWWAQLSWSPLHHHHYSAQSIWSRALAQRWEETLQRNAGALVDAQTIDLARYFPPLRSFRKVLSHPNCESFMAERRAQVETNILKKMYLRNQAGKIARLEREFCPHFDANLAVSELDAERLRLQSPGAHFHVVENGTDTDFFVPSTQTPESNSLVFAGGLSWYPNVSGISFFIKEIWPLLKSRCQSIRLCLAGRSPVAELTQLAERDPAITVVADPADIRPFVRRASVFVCPIIDGGGTRLKILDALAMGKAVVSTTIGCEGLAVEHGKHLLVADSPQEFANAVLSLLGDESLRRRLGEQGRAQVEKLYSWKVIGEHLEEAYSCAMGEKPCSPMPA